MIINDGILTVLVAALLSCMGWAGRKLAKLAVDVEKIKWKLHMQ